MGGPGSGPQVQSERPLVENSLEIDINQLCRDGSGDGCARDLSWVGRGLRMASAHCRLSGGGLMILMVGTDGATGRRELGLQEVQTTTTPCHFGGERRFFLCPGRAEELREMGAYNTLGDGGICGRRATKLYRPPGQKRFLCRHCWNLAYRSQRETEDLRMARRAMAIRRRLGQRDPEEPFPPRPRGMHHQTYQRLQAEYMALDTAGMYLTLKRFGLITHEMQALLDGKVD